MSIDGQINIDLRLVMFGILDNYTTDTRDIVNWELISPAISNAQFRLLWPYIIHKSTSYGSDLIFKNSHDEHMIFVYL